ncbi:hypothetical protein Dsin_027967 [Dipteronia sinensis]|uniref:MADS-box domain-containing protein n=1 Tax=Dipteronia sinensis TaxID=43782 RepID=A0AAD9ZRC8_9ROSI|nr:hypothetical protein Dsin_027967 [Dipteronia sinensis]
MQSQCNEEDGMSSMQACNKEGEIIANRSSGSKRPKGTGRKKIEIKEIENKLSRKVAFSKRRKGLFKKAAEICQLCGAQIAIIVFSTKGRLFSYGYPSVEDVVNRFLSENSDESNSAPSPEEAAEEKKKEEEELPPLVGGGGIDQEGYWFEESIDGLDSEKLQEYMCYLECLRKNLELKVEELIMRRTTEIDYLQGFGG